METERFDHALHDAFDLATAGRGRRAVGRGVVSAVAPSAAQQSAKPLTVAFIGDQGSTSNSRAVLRMIKQHGADMVLHQGDFDYRRNPRQVGRDDQ